MSFDTGKLVTAAAITAVPTTALTGTLQAAQEPAHTGDVTNSAGSLALTIAAGAVTPAKLANPKYWIRQGSNYTYPSSTTAQQKMFNASANGALSLPVGQCAFRGLMRLTNMDTVSGNLVWSLLGAGTAVLDEVMIFGTGRDGTGLDTPGTWSAWLAEAESNGTSFATTAAQAFLGMKVEGSFKVTTAGTIIPSVALSTAAAATTRKGSFLIVEYLGDNSAQHYGWS